MEQGDVSILIPAYGPGHLVDSCLLTVMLTSAPNCVLVWDNGIDHQDISEEGTKVEETRLLDHVYSRTQEGRDLTRPQSVWNLGFAEACNRMAAEATSDLLVFLNCDTEPQEGWLEALVRAFDDPTIGVVGSRLIWPDGKLQHAGVKVVLGGGIAWAAEIMEDLPTRDVAAVTGACMAVRRSVFEEVGGFDSQFWHVFDDVDFCLRVLQSSHRIRYVRESLVLHHQKATGSERTERAFHQVVRFQEKWANSNVVQQDPSLFVSSKANNDSTDGGPK